MMDPTTDLAQFQILIQTDRSIIENQNVIMLTMVALLSNNEYEESLVSTISDIVTQLQSHLDTSVALINKLDTLSNTIDNILKSKSNIVFHE